MTLQIKIFNDDIVEDIQQKTSLEQRVNNFCLLHDVKAIKNCGGGLMVVYDVGQSD